MNAWWQLSNTEALSKLDSDASNGLSEQEAQRRMVAFGANTLVEQALKSVWSILREQFKGILMGILIIAAIVSATMGEYADAVVILIIVMLNALLGLSQEYRAEKAMAALKKMSTPTVKVRRDGSVQAISSRNLVPGDILILEAGNLVPADCRLLETANLRIQEAALTGESEPVEKNSTKLINGAITLGDRRNMAYMGTIVTYGRGLALITATGMRTELGGIATLIQSVKREATPLQKRLGQLGKGLAIASLALVAIILLQGLIRGGTSVENIRLMLLTAISMAVAAVPEGLPAVVTIALALGAQRMLARRALIRKLLAVETLGSVTVICSDKTGTLTENRMTVTVLDVGGDRIDLAAHLQRSGPVSAGTAQATAFLDAHPGAGLLLSAGALCNDAILDPRATRDKQTLAIGDPTEGALVVAAASIGLWKHDLEQVLARVAETPFDSDRRRMTTVHRIDQAVQTNLAEAMQLDAARRLPYVSFCKGAVDSLLDVCTQTWAAAGPQPITASRRKEILAANDALAQIGMRVLGIAFRLLDENGVKQDMERDLVFLGLIGMIDPPRQEVRTAVQTCRTAGIRPVMITGDHPLTALEIARQLGIASGNTVLTGTALDELSLEKLAEQVENVAVYARVSPEHKLKIVQALQQRGHVVAMTGDGVNDAPALRKSDIGVAMGITGTDVTKEAADMVLLDDNFATIVAAVEEGRVIYDNIRKFIKYLLSTNSGELWVMLLAPFFGMPLPLVPIQILWMNLVTDGLPALALSVEPAECDIMLRRPRRITENIFGEGIGWHILWVGLLMCIVSLGAGFWVAGFDTAYFSDPDIVRHFRTMVFTTLTFLQLAHVLAIRSHRQSLFTIGVLSNPFMLGAVLLTVMLQLVLVYVPFFQKFFQTVPLSGTDLVGCILLSSTLFWAVELEKFLIRRKASA